MQIQEPLVGLDMVDPAWDRSRSTEFEPQDRERERDSEKIKVRIFKYGGKKLSVRACSDYQDILHLPGDKLRGTGATHFQ
jgi:hypothetical protein